MVVAANQNGDKQGGWAEKGGSGEREVEHFAGVEEGRQHIKLQLQLQNVSIP